MASIRNYSTDAVIARDRTSFWRDQVWASVGAFDVKAADDRFLGSAAMRRVGDLTVARVRASPHQLSRSVAQVRGDDRRLFKLVVQHEGTIFLEQRDKRVVLKPGQWMLYDITRPFRFHTTEATSQSAILLRAEDARVGDLTPYSLQTYCGEHGYSNVLRTALTTASSEHGEDSVDGDIGVMITRLARLALLEHANHEVRRSNQQLMRERVDAYLDLHLRRFELSIDSIAHGLNCSKRYLHKIFIDSGCTLSEYILKRRLEACRVDLVNPAMAASSVTDIAYACGFSSLAYFSRVFKQTYGESPSNYRTMFGSSSIGTIQ